MILAAVVCPHPPLLLRELSGAEDAVPDLRRACRDALHEGLATEPGAVVVVGGADAAGEWDPALPVDARPFGTSDPPRPAGSAGAAHGAGLPLSLGVAKRLLEEAGWGGPVRLLSVPWDADGQALAQVARDALDGERRVVLLVMGDGSNCRGEKAPGHLDERAFAYDAEVVRALERGDAAALSRLDPVLGADLAVAGRAAFGVLGAAVSAQDRNQDRNPGADQVSRPVARLHYADDPFGVQYTVAVWDLRPVG